MSGSRVPATFKSPTRSTRLSSVNNPTSGSSRSITYGTTAPSAPLSNQADLLRYMFTGGTRHGRASVTAPIPDDEETSFTSGMTVRATAENSPPPPANRRAAAPIISCRPRRALALIFIVILLCLWLYMEAVENEVDGLKSELAVINPNHESLDLVKAIRHNQSIILSDIRHLKSKQTDFQNKIKLLQVQQANQSKIMNDKYEQLNGTIQAVRDDTKKSFEEAKSQNLKLAKRITDVEDDVSALTQKSNYYASKVVDLEKNLNYLAYKLHIHLNGASRTTSGMGQIGLLLAALICTMWFKVDY